MKKKLLMTIGILMTAACLAVGCGDSSKETEKQTETQSAAETTPETVAETEAETEATEATEATETTAPETESSAPETDAAAEPKFMYVTADVYVRQAADADSEALTVAKIGDEVIVYEEDEKWAKITLGDIGGYVVKEYLTESKAEADAAAKAEADAKAAAEAAAAAAAQGNSDGQQQGGRYEVSRQKFDDCDGSGHGYYEITYSDGTVETEEY